MARTVAVGVQDFSKMVENNCFYVDKTHFIKEWWESRDDVTLITRPRRFGKSMAAEMLLAYYDKNCISEDLFKKTSYFQ